MTAPYEIVDVTPDTPEWLEERRASLGASEVPGVLGLSQFQTPRSVYLSKHGIDQDFDHELAFFGHDAERTMTEWIHEFRPDLGAVHPGFMARSTRWPWLHASFDRLLQRPDGTGRFLQIKSAHQFAASEWKDEGIPLWVQAQVQAEIAVSGDDGEYVGLILGGRKGQVKWVARDEDFIRDYLVPRTREFWEGNVLVHVEPAPSTIAELPASTPGVVAVADDEIADLAGLREVLLSDAKAMEEEAKEYQLRIGQYMGDAESLQLADGTPILTFKTQQGRRGVDIDRLETEHPDIAAELVTRGTPFRVMRMARARAKETAK